MDKDIHHPHDTGYKYLLSSKKAFIQLLRSFIHRDWVRHIDESHLVKLDKSYILPDFSKKEADIVYQLTLKDQDIIFYILLELQSTVDYQMPYRLLLYQIEIWRDVMKNTKPHTVARKNFRLPSIVPIVLYNGKSEWTAKRRFRETLSGERLFGNELLDFQYLLIDLKRYTDEELLELTNLIGTVFYLEQTDNVEELLNKTRVLAKSVSELSEEELNIFITWMTGIFKRRLPLNEQQAVEELAATMEKKGVGDVLSNIERVLDEWGEQKIKEGIEKGMEEGIEEGIEKGTERVAKEMLLADMPLEQIMQFTKLSREKLEQLKRETH